MRGVIRSLKAFDLDQASSELRLAASETRTLADTVAVVAPEAEQHFLRAATALEHSAASLDRFQITTATSWLSQGTNEVMQGVDLVDASTYC